jgi:hypothetical protein
LSRRLSRFLRIKTGSSITFDHIAPRRKRAVVSQ